MASPALVGDIGGTNSRFALVDEGVEVRDIEKYKNDDFPSLEAAAREYLDRKGHPKVRALVLRDCRSRHRRADRAHQSRLELHAAPA